MNSSMKHFSPDAECLYSLMENTGTDLTSHHLVFKTITSTYLRGKDEHHFCAISAIKPGRRKSPPFITSESHTTQNIPCALDHKT